MTQFLYRFVRYSSVGARNFDSNESDLRSTFFELSLVCLTLDQCRAPPMVASKLLFSLVNWAVSVCRIAPSDRSRIRRIANERNAPLGAEKLAHPCSLCSL